MGGPDGGDGGKGGDVWLVVNHNVSSLIAFKDHPHRGAGSGTYGKGKGKHGRSGEDIIVPAPEGPAVKTEEGDPCLPDLGAPCHRVLVTAGARCGAGI